jgi:hypothetical protein
MIWVVHPGSRIQILTFCPSRIQGSKRVKKAPDPGSGSATLKELFIVFCTQFSGSKSKTLRPSWVEIWTFRSGTGYPVQIWDQIRLNFYKNMYSIFCQCCRSSISSKSGSSSGSVSRVLMTKYWRKKYTWKKNIFFWLKIVVHLSPGLQKGRPSYSLQKRTSRTSFLPSWIRIQGPHWIWIRSTVFSITSQISLN